MKKLFLGFVAFLFAIVLNAQAPQTINYQAVLRDNAGSVIADQIVNLRFNIIDASSTTVYSEEYSGYSVNAYGLISVKIGNGTPVTGTFDALDWQNNNYSLQVEVDAGNGFEQFVAEEFSSVPYALNTTPEYWIKTGNHLAYTDSTQSNYNNSITINRPLSISSGDDMLEMIAPASPSTENFQFIEMQQGPTVKARINGNGSAEFKNVIVSENRSDSTTVTPVSGTVYRDNLPMAWGYILSGGSISSEFGVESCVYNSTDNTYTITLDNSWKYSPAIVVSPITYSGAAEIPGVVVNSNTNVFVVKVFDGANPSNTKATDFMFTVFARPQ